MIEIRPSILMVTGLLLVTSVFADFKDDSQSKGVAKDDCTFIREQLAALPATGGTIKIPEGTYTCSSPIVLDKDNVGIQGVGKVTLKLADNSNSPNIVMGDLNTPPKPIKNIKVSDLIIVGNRLHQTEECWSGPCDNGGLTAIRNNGISIRGVTNGEIRNISISGASSGGVVSELGCFGMVIDNLTSQDNQFDGFAGYQTYGAVLDHLTLMNNLAAGISIDIDFSHNTIRNTHIEGNGDVGIFMRDSNSNLFENVTIDKGGNHGVFLSSVDDDTTCPTDNEFRNLSVSSSKGVGFRFNSPCKKNRLTGQSTFTKNRDGCVTGETKGHLSVQGTMTCIK